MQTMKSVVSTVVRKVLGLPAKDAKCCGTASEPRSTKETPREAKREGCC